MKFRNAFLSSMDSSDLEALSPQLRENTLYRGQTLSDAGAIVSTIYFPSTSVIGKATVMHDGRSVETATVGCENAAGLLAGVAQVATLTRMFVQTS